MISRSLRHFLGPFSTSSPNLRSVCCTEITRVVLCCKMSSKRSSDEVLFEAIGSKRIITLNRPKALNALNLSMVEAMLTHLKAWQQQTDVSMIIIRGQGDKAFCAGGDIKAVTEEGRKDPTSMNATKFFRREYMLNHAIGTSERIPIVALIDGITMGGGVGISVHASFRVASERTVFAMPETAIGLFPDVGGGYFLPRLRGALGSYLALTGHRLKGEDVYHAGVATHFVNHANNMYEELARSLMDLEKPTHESIKTLLDSYHSNSVSGKAFSLAAHQKQIDAIFASSTVEGILESLSNDGSDWALKTRAVLLKMSPTSLKVTLEQLQRGKTLTLAEVLAMELRIVRTVMLNHDFYEGVRALLISKDNNPIWAPKSLGEVTTSLVATYFNPMPTGCELNLQQIDCTKRSNM